VAVADALQLEAPTSRQLFSAVLTNFILRMRTNCYSLLFKLKCQKSRSRSENVILSPNYCSLSGNRGR